MESRDIDMKAVEMLETPEQNLANGAAVKGGCKNTCSKMLKESSDEKQLSRKLKRRFSEILNLVQRGGQNNC